jgi:hypothetical protein
VMWKSVEITNFSCVAGDVFFSIVLNLRHLRLVRARSEWVVDCRKFELQITAKNRYNPHPIPFRIIR